MLSLILFVSRRVAIPELAANPLASRIISVMDISEVNFQSFIKVLNVFSPQTCVIEKLDCKSLYSRSSTLTPFFLVAFKIYDVNNDGYVSRSDLFEILSLLIGDNMEEEMIYSLVDTAIKDADTDGDGRISRDEFRCFFKGDDSIVGMMSIEF